MNLPREVCKLKSLTAPKPNFSVSPIQAGMGGCPWRVAIASMLIQRGRSWCVRFVLDNVLKDYPNPEVLARSEYGALEYLLRPSMLRVNYARQLQRMSIKWLGNGWNDMRELPGVSVYVSDCVSVFCFNATTTVTNNEELKEYINAQQVSR